MAASLKEMLRKRRIYDLFMAN